MTWALKNKYKLKKWRGVGGYFPFERFLPNHKLLRWQQEILLRFSRQCHTGWRAFDWINTAAIFLRIKKTPLGLQKTQGEKGTWRCWIFIYTLNTSDHCYKARTQVLSPKAESLPALPLLGLLSSLQDHLATQMAIAAEN